MSNPNQGQNFPEQGQGRGEGRGGGRDTAPGQNKPAEEVPEEETDEADQA